MLMVQTNTQVPMNRSKLKGPPPVPPRPNNNIVAEALAKTRKIPADTKPNKIPKPKPILKELSLKSKTLDKNCSPPNVSPRINGLARVKSFIRDVINSSEEKKSNHDSIKKSNKSMYSSNSSVSSKSSPESSKSLKNSKLIMRSLSTSNKLESDTKKVSKSSSFAEKTIPLRKAPPPPMSPKPKLRHIKGLAPPKPVNISIVDKSERNSIISNQSEPEQFSQQIYVTSSDVNGESIVPVDDSPRSSLHSTVIDSSNTSEVVTIDGSLSRQSSSKSTPSLNLCVSTEKLKQPSTPDNNNASVTDILISEILASQNKQITCNNNVDSDLLSEMDEMLGSSTYFISGDSEEKDRFKDLSNHEKLIYELQKMKEEECFNGYQSEYQNINDCFDDTPSIIYDKINDDEVHLYECDIEDSLRNRLREQLNILSRMPLSGLPPLPKCLSGFTIDRMPCQDKTNESNVNLTTHVNENSASDMDSQLAHLKKEMAALRSLDLSLLSELWTLSESMISWRSQIEHAPRLRPAPPPPPPPARHNK